MKKHTSEMMYCPQNHRHEKEWVSKQIRQFPPGIESHVRELHEYMGNYEVCRFFRGGSKSKGKDLIKTITLNYGPDADSSTVSEYAKNVIKDILLRAGETSATITSTVRDAKRQAEVMYKKLESEGIASQKNLYSSAGDKVIDTYANAKKKGKNQDEIKNEMEAKINEVGCTKVTKHCVNPKILVVVDIAPSSIKNKKEFINAVETDNRINNFLKPPKDRKAYHLEIPEIGQ